MSRRLALGVTTVLISAHAGKASEAPPPVIDIPGALGILVHDDGSARHFVGGVQSSAAFLSEASEVDESYVTAGETGDVTSDSNYDSETKAPAHRGTLGIAGHAGKAFKNGFKGFKGSWREVRKAGKMIGRTVAQAPSVLPSLLPVSSFSGVTSGK